MKFEVQPAHYQINFKKCLLLHCVTINWKSSMFLIVILKITFRIIG